MCCGDGGAGPAASCGCVRNPPTLSSRLEDSFRCAISFLTLNVIGRQEKGPLGHSPPSAEGTEFRDATPSARGPDVPAWMPPPGA